MKILKDTKELHEIVSVLSRGGIVVYPTETMYGIGVDATNSKAVKKLAKYKNRPFGKPYSIAVSSQKMAEKYVQLNSTARKLYRQFLPGPITIVSRGKHKVAPGVESEDGTLGVRIPDYRLVVDIVRKLGKPITATSANASYKKRPYSVSDILENIGVKQMKLIDLIIDAGNLPRNEPSTVIDTTLDDVVTLRQGEIKLKNTNEILSKSEESTQNLAKELWQRYEIYKGKRAIVFALQGEMGTGKTAFTKGLARSMGIVELITSPTYALENKYLVPSSRYSLTHIDAWRMSNSEELSVLDFEKTIKKGGVVAIEWAERVKDAIRRLDDEAIVIWVKISFGKKQTDRLISWSTV